MLLFSTAGNEGNKPWGKIIFPADAPNILTIGAITCDSVRSVFSSAGFTSDGRIKPDLMAMGTSSAIIESNGQISHGNGTSFATPTLAGLGACLWQALPDFTSFEMIDLLRETANAFASPDSLVGYGIADVYKAYMQNKTGLNLPGTEKLIPFTITSRENQLYLNLNRSVNHSKFILNIYSIVGIKMLSVSNVFSPVDISSLPRGIYFAHLQIDSQSAYVRKFIK